MTSLARGFLVAFAALLLLGPAPARGAGPLSITSNQPFSPGFDRSVGDYVVRCSGAPLVVSVAADPEIQVSVDHAPLRTGTFQRAVPLGTGQAFPIAVREGGVTTRYSVRCLPQDFPTYTYRRDGSPFPALFAVTPSFGGPESRYLAVFDANGVPVWWAQGQGAPVDAEVLADGTVAYFDTVLGAYQVYTLDGRFVRQVATVGFGTDLHELQLLPNGNYLLGAYVTREGVDLSPFGGPSDTSVLDAELQEVTPGGQLVWRWNSGDHIALEETPQRWYDVVFQGGPPYDIAHFNSIEARANEVVVSMRHHDAVFAIDRGTGTVLWKLGGVRTARSLTMLGDPSGAYPLGGQHDARFLPDGTLTIYDNATGLGRSPRSVRYRINRPGRSATLLEAVSDPEIPVSFCCGSTRRLDGGWLTYWGGTPTVGAYGADGARVFRLDFALLGYRAQPLPAGVRTGDLRAAMNAQYPRQDDNLPPVAAFGAAPNPALTFVTIRFNGRASSDPDGEIVSYEWDFADGTTGEGHAPAHVYKRAGKYTVRLTVTDDDGATDFVEHLVVIQNRSPEASISVAPNRPRVGRPAAFDGNASDPDGDVVSYEWTFGDGSSSAEANPSHVYARRGQYRVRLTVTDDGGAQTTVSRLVRVVR